MKKFKLIKATRNKGKIYEMNKNQENEKLAFDNLIKLKASNATKNIMNKVLYNFSGRYISENKYEILEKQERIFKDMQTYYTISKPNCYVVIFINEWFYTEIDDIYLMIYETSKEVTDLFRKEWQETNGLVRWSFDDSFTKYYNDNFSERVVKL